MKIIVFFITLLLNLNLIVKAEMEIDLNKKYSINAETIKISKNGILLGEYSNVISSKPFNGVYLDNTGNLNFSSKALASFKITDLDEDEQNYYATSYMAINSQQGLFKISKDFKNISNIGVKAATKKLLVYKDKIYTGGYTHGCYVVNKDGTNLIQILGDGFFGPQIDDIKANSKNVYVLSRGNLYKVNYDTNQKEQIIMGQRPSFMEIDENRIYIIAYNKFYYLNFDNTLSNEKSFFNKISYFKKFNNLLIIVETDYNNNYFWISNDNGITFYKSKTVVPASMVIKEIEILGEKNYTLYFNIANQGIFKGNLNFDFDNSKVLDSPFKISKPSDLKDKITSFFDHRYPYLGNKIEPEEYKNTTLNFQGKELVKPYIYYSSHDGIDWGLPLNTPIYSVADGTASYAYDFNGLGNYIKIIHDNGFITIYGHLANEDLLLKEGTIKVSKGQKIGKVGMSGNTNGPHLHFTTYYGEKILNNKVDPFGWEGKFKDPWEEFSLKSNYLWSYKPPILTTQLNPSNSSAVQNENIKIDIINLSFLNNPVNIDLENTPPIYDQINYLYKYNTSFSFRLYDFESKEMASSVLGLISYSGFNYGDDRFYSIWKLKENNVEKQTTVYNEEYQTLSTIFEPTASYLVIKDNYRKAVVKSKVGVK